MIRPATMQDIPRILDMGDQLLAATRSPIKTCRLKTGEFFARLINDPDGLVLVSPGGFVAGCVTEQMFNDERAAFEWGWFASDGSGLKLLLAFEKWAWEKGATLIKVSASGGNAQRIFEHRGYEAVDTTMVKQCPQ